jgi:nucleotide-binding universal stress UspA family protein
MGGFYVPHIPIERFHDEAVKGAEKELESVCEKQLQGCPNFQKRLLFGDPIQKILETIESEKIGLVIMGTHGRKGLEHGFLLRLVLYSSSNSLHIHGVNGIGVSGGMQCERII